MPIQDLGYDEVGTPASHTHNVNLSRIQRLPETQYVGDLLRLRSLIPAVSSRTVTWIATQALHSKYLRGSTPVRHEAERHARLLQHLESIHGARDCVRRTCQHPIHIKGHSEGLPGDARASYRRLCRHYYLLPDTISPLRGLGGIPAMEVLANPNEELQELLDDLEYEPEEVSIPNLPGGHVTVLTVDEIPLELLASLESANAEISGRRVWPGSALLSLALCSGSLGVDISGISVVELGAGSGLAGMCAARLGASKVVVTDGDQTSVDLARQNIQANNLGDEVIREARLLWGSGDETQAFLGNHTQTQGFDLVIAGDVMYKHELPPLFFETVKGLLSPEGRCLLCHLPRAGVSQGIVTDCARACGLKVEALPPIDASDIEQYCSAEEAHKAALYCITL